MFDLKIKKKKKKFPNLFNISPVDFAYPNPNLNIRPDNFIKIQAIIEKTKKRFQILMEFSFQAYFRMVTTQLRK